MEWNERAERRLEWSGKGSGEEKRWIKARLQALKKNKQIKTDHNDCCSVRMLYVWSALLLISIISVRPNY